jgi:hypothetical protein
MEICYRGHEEICFEDYCPVCELIEKMKNCPICCKNEKITKTETQQIIENLELKLFHEESLNIILRKEIEKYKEGKK